MRNFQVDLVIVGGGLGGCAAALSACSKGLNVLMTEETSWLGGQSTTQGVPPDEHPWIEEFGATSSYRLYRQKIRDFYKNELGVIDEVNEFNPGRGIVSKICHDPRISVHVLNELVTPYLLSGQLTILKESIVMEVEKSGSTILKAKGKNVNSDTLFEVVASYFIDATETGSLLPIADIEYTTGAESKLETNEPHALDVADPKDIQAFTYVLAMEYRPGENHVIEKPEMYAFWKSFQPDIWPDKLLSFYAPHPITREKREYSLFANGEHFPLWDYRKILDPLQFEKTKNLHEVTLLNWPQNDYFLGNIYDVSTEEQEKHEYQAKQLTLSLLYWLQTEAPRPDGLKGYPGIKLRHDVFETEDGLAKSAYIRESRRIKARYTIIEQDVSPSFHSGTGKCYEDSVGIGSYSIDLHPSMTGRNYLDIEALPFHIPLGALIPQDAPNLLAGAKNIGTTHITNGCYRLHPVEWNIGEVGGLLAAFCLEKDITPEYVHDNKEWLGEFQNQLEDAGIELRWPEKFYE